MDKIINKVAEFIDKQKLFDHKEKLLIGISGGSDSIFLSDILCTLKYNLSLAHFNFQLRDNESDKDEDFVRGFAAEKNLKLFVNKTNTNEYASNHKLSIQEAARKLRYDWFNELKNKNNFNKILTAHHQDDNIETMLHNFIRGSGIKGIMGIPIINSDIVRPLLCISKKDILSYLNEKKIMYNNDRSNDDIKYKRNHIRHKLIPLISEINPSYLKTISQNSQILRSEFKYLEDKIETDLQKALIKKENNAQHYSIITILKSKSPDLLIHNILNKHGYTHDQKNNIYDAIKNKRFGLYFSSNSTKVYLERKELILSLETYSPQSHYIKKDASEIKIQGLKLNFKLLENSSDISFNDDVELIDYDALEFPLTLRSWKNGDYFYPLGLNKKKKLKKYFSDKKMSNYDKKNQWILQSGLKIAYIINERIDHRFRVTDKTKNVLEIKNEKLS